MRIYSRFHPLQIFAPIVAMVSWWCLFLVCVCGNLQKTWANTPSCEQLYNANRYLESVHCFSARAKNMKHGSSLDAIDKAQKEESLLRAVQSLEKLALQEKIEKAALLKEQAIGLIDWILRENLCESQRCQQHRLRRETLHKQIGYATLTIDTSSSLPADVKIEGYHFQQKHRAPPSWSQSVRPGPYVVEVLYLGRVPLRREIQVLPGQASRVIFELPQTISPQPTTKPLVDSNQPPPPRRINMVPSPPPKPTSPSVAPWIVVGIGATILIAGVIGVGVGYANDQKIDSTAAAIRSEAVGKTPEQLDLMLQTDRSAVGIQNMYQSNQAALTFGWIAMGTGTATALVGTFWWLLSKRNTGPTPHSSATLTKSSRSSFWKE